MGNSPITLDFSKVQPADETQPVKLDFSKAVPLNPTPEQSLSRTNSLMSLAMGGQQRQMNPQDQAQFNAGRYFQNRRKSAASDSNATDQTLIWPTLFLEMMRY
jgi:hypothetical protein